MTTLADLDFFAKRKANQYQQYLREGSELQGYAEADPGRIVFYITGGKVPFEPQGKAAGYIARTAIEDHGLEEVIAPVLNYLITLDHQDRLVMTSESSSAPAVCVYGRSFEILI